MTGHILPALMMFGVMSAIGTMGLLRSNAAARRLQGSFSGQTKQGSRVNASHRATAPACDRGIHGRGIKAFLPCTGIRQSRERMTPPPVDVGQKDFDMQEKKPANESLRRKDGVIDQRQQQIDPAGKHRDDPNAAARRPQKQPGQDPGHPEGSAEDEE